MMSQKKADKIIKQTAKIYDKIAPHFAATREKLWPEITSWRKYLQVGDSVLDAGCGSGRLLQLFTDLNISYYGIDISARLLEIAKQSSEHYKPSKVHWQQASILSLPFADNFFDHVFCIATLQHIPSAAYRFQGLAELYRVLKSGGRLFMTNWYLWNKWANKKYHIARQVKVNWLWGVDKGDVFIPWHSPQLGLSVKRYYHAFKKPELKTLLQSVGFLIEELKLVSHQSESDVMAGRGENLVAIVRKP